MITAEQIPDLAHARVIDQDDDSVGVVGQILADPTSGRPTWVGVKAGLRGREYFVPAEGVTLEGEGVVRVSYDKKTVTHGPHLELDGPLSREQEAVLHAHYRYGDESGTDGEDDRGRGRHRGDGPVDGGRAEGAATDEESHR